MKSFFIYAWNMITLIFAWRWKNFGNFSWRVKRLYIFMWMNFGKEYRGPSDYEAHTFCNFSALDNVSGKRSIEENWKQNCPLERLILPFYFTNNCTCTILHVKCLWISLGTKLLRSGKNLDNTFVTVRVSRRVRFAKKMSSCKT